MKRIEVDASALRQVLEALSGSPHRILELIATRNLPCSANPIDILVAEFNAAASSPAPPKSCVKQILPTCDRCKASGITCLTPDDPCHIKKDKKP